MYKIIVLSLAGKVISHGVEKRAKTSPLPIHGVSASYSPMVQKHHFEFEFPATDANKHPMNFISQSSLQNGISQLSLPEHTKTIAR